MTIPECSIEKSAAVLVDIFGDQAPAQARERMDEYRRGVYKEGYRFWSAVAQAATKRLDQKRAGNAQRSPDKNTGAPVPLRVEILPGHG